MRRLPYPRAARPDNGQTLVEFALILLLILALLFGLMEFARAWQYSNAITNGVRDGARYASTLANSTSFETRVKNYTFGQITSAIPRDTMTVDNVTVQFENDSTLVTVEATYDFVILTGQIIPGFQGTRQLTRHATMKYR